MFKISRFLVALNPSRLLLFGYLSFILVGFGLLCLPWAQAEPSAIIDHLFIAASAVSTTGLATISPSDSYTLFGEIIIILGIQIGGIGYMSVASFIILGSRRRISKFASRLLRTDFSLDEKSEVRGFVRGVIFFAFAIEFLGAVALYFIFKNEGVDNPVWSAIFHSISAFCTAGFSLFNNSFEDFSGNVALNVVIAVLALAGSIGFIVFVDLYQRLFGKTDKLTFTSKIILRFTFFLLIVGIVLIVLTESSFGQNEWLLGFFQAMTSLSTVGFNTFPIGEMAVPALLVITLLMLIGASPAGTGGGIKSTSITAMFAVARSTLLGREKITLMHREIPANRLRLAATNFFFYMSILFAGVVALSVTEVGADVFMLIFEAISAIGTVGLSMGITGDLTFIGKCIVIFLMILGRVGRGYFRAGAFSKRGG